MTGVGRFFLLAQALPRLGFANLARVATYRLKTAAKMHRFAAPAPYPKGVPFPGKSIQGVAGEPEPLRQALFGWYEKAWESPPDWHQSPFAPEVRLPAEQSWSEALRDLSMRGGDPKVFWELSRFYWVPQLAYIAAGGDGTALRQLNEWLSHWVAHNQPYRGINWACGQEASIRVMNLALAAFLVGGNEAPSPALRWIVRAHLDRIAPTIGYGIGQANNHGCAEAVALFIGGTWLGMGGQDPISAAWARLGRRWLIDRAMTLIQPDGTGNQYSTTYHRANLEAFCLAELWRRKLALPLFPQSFSNRLRLGARWLHQLTDPETGDAPNIGPNDGSHLFSLNRAPYRDFRPTVQLAAALFDNAQAYPAPQDFEDRTTALGLATPPTVWPAAKSHTYYRGGCHVLRCLGAVAYLRFPCFRFRPGHADALHLDLWVGAQNLLRDSGTHTYAASPDETAHFSSSRAHNTVEFDGHDQMPRLGQFLFGAWVKARDVRPVQESSDALEAAAGYCDHWGAHHHRHVALYETGLTCTDNLGGSASRAVLRWRLMPGDWRLVSGVVTNGSVTLRVTSDRPLSIALREGMESRHYLKKTPLPVLEVETGLPAQLITKIMF
jgi:hypothetical protein